MSRPRNSLRAAAAAAAMLAGLGGCDGAPVDAVTGGNAPLPKLGLMSSLPLYWPLGAEMGEIAAGTAPVPWQRQALARDYTIEPLDTLSPIPALAPGQPDTDPLAGLARLAVIQPRGLSPADNVALDDWVREGGRLLLVLDPMLTGEYDLPLGDPRRPVDSALIPPVAKRWGFGISLPDEDSTAAPPGRDTLPGGSPVPLDLHGEVTVSSPFAAACVSHGRAGATCAVGKGRVTLIADAALFENPDMAGQEGAALRAVLREAFE